MWGVLPIALKGIMQTLDPVTTTFFRFAIAAFIITPYLFARNKLVNKHKFNSPKLFLQLLCAGILLTANYALYIFGLERTTAEAAQVMMQLAPILLLLSGVWIFKERFSPAQWIGFATFLSGLLIFTHLNDYGIGLLMLASAAITWVGYAVIQKLLIKEFNAQETMLVFYWIGALAFLPFSNFTLLVDLTLLQWTLVIFCGLNTLVAYGCFSEALMHIEASRVSAVIAMTPLITVFFVQSVPFAGVVAEPIGLVTIIGAACVVSGSLVTATMKNKT